MTKFKDFSISGARPLPVIILADISSSMEADAKIQTLNKAIKEMLSAFVEEESGRVGIHVAVITFGNNQAKIHLPLTPASQIEWQDMQAYGNTPLGAALKLAKNMIEDKEQIPSKAYSPTLILISDGHPNDKWEKPLEDLLKSERPSKAMRMAMGIGADANFDMLEKFLAQEEARVFHADEARQIRNFFRWVTMSITQRSHSVNPNEFSILPPEETDLFLLDEDEDDF